MRSGQPTPSRRPFEPVTRWISRHRRPVAAGCAALAVAAALAAVRPPDPPSTRVLVAARDLPAGHRLASDDLATSDLPAGAAPPGALDQSAAVDGRVLAVPMQAGEPVSLSRLSSPESLAVQARALGSGLVAVPVRLGEASTTDLLRPGDVVDVWAARATSAVRGLGDDATEDAAGTVETARRVAAGVRVLAVPRTASTGGILDGGDAGSSGVVVLAVPPAGVGPLAQAAATDRLAVAVLPAPAR